MYLSKKEKDLLYQIINFYNMSYDQLKGKFFLIKNEEEYKKAYINILNKMKTLEEEIRK